MDSSLRAFLSAHRRIHAETFQAVAEVQFAVFFSNGRTFTLTDRVTTFPLQPASLACTVNEKVPAAIGLPLMTPSAGDNVRPSGRRPLARLHSVLPVPPSK